ncbi:hypothetical protein [Desulfobacula toluolica]|uniref:Conserved uncharacterized protein n=1 Tax=Desulfobacula toluolica (strain DSM 7467 / Tol2) TaxID=651182 RepID=K0NLJ0_DESTT|nr:hypothetical protein [Desulfobacula toluolica]CCK81605.1 conserved uncharacterized protein [Desulfobacula toluolica Tol2]
MKLTNPEIIQESEKEFIDTINAELDWEAIEKLLLEKHGFTLQDEIDYKDGDLVVYNNKIAYKFDFEIKVPLSVIFNRQGECLKMSTLRDDFEDENDLSQKKNSLKPINPEQQNDTVAQMASNIASMISEINHGDD